MDILHVAYVRLYRVDAFVSFDKRQKQLASAAGLSVVELG